MILAGVGAGAPGWWYVAGVVYSAAFVPVAMRGPETMWKRFGAVWAAAIVVSVVCTWSEALIFVPAAARLKDLGGALFLYTLMALALAVMAAALKMVRPGEGPAARLRGSGGLLAGMLVGGLAYLVYYYVLGGIFFELLTKPYYTGSGVLGNAREAVLRLGFWFPLIQVGRGALMTAAVLPIIATLRMNRRATAIVVGLLVWVIGGLAPLIPPNAMMPLQLRIFHIAEIFTQNFLLGVTAVLVLRPRATAAERAVSASA